MLKVIVIDRALKLLVRENCEMLRGAEQNMASLYRVIYSRPELVLAETNDGFRIHRQTYGEGKRRAEEIAAALYARIGAGHRYVALAMENSPEWIAAFWGILMSGNKPYLVNLRHPASLSNGILRTLHIDTILCDVPGALEGSYIPVSELKGAGEAPREFENELAISTSATTLREVICFYDGAAICAQIMNVDHILSANDRMPKPYHGQIKQLAFLPFYHIFGLFAVYFWFTFFNRTFVFLSDYAPDTLLKTCRKHEVTHLFAVPLLWHTVERQLNHELEKRGEKAQKKFRRGLALCTRLQDVFPYAGSTWAKRIMRDVTDELFGPSLQFCISGGSYLRDSALKLFNGIGYAIHNGYSMSEIGITSVELDPRASGRNRNSIGMPFPSVEYRISEKGTLQVRGDSLCTRMLANGEPVPREGEWFDTGDIMTVDSRGRYYIQGRAGDLVIGENGENINPDALEQRFTLKDARAFSVLGLEQDGSEQLTLVIQASPYVDGDAISRMRDELMRVNETLPEASRIRRVSMTHDPIAPETAIKVGRQYLRRGIANGSIRLLPLQAAGTAGGAESPMAEKVRQIVAGELGVEPGAIGYDDNLMLDQGMTSLQYFAVLARLSEAFQLSSKGTPEAYCRSIREFCDYIAREAR